MKTITLTVCNRPLYTRKTLESLRRANTKGYKLVISVEPGCKSVLKECKKVDFMPVEIHVNKTRLGINWNNKSVYDKVFADGSLFNIALEDDTPLSPDALDLANWFFQDPSRDKYLLLNLFNLGKSMNNPVSLFEDKGFSPWGYCITRSKYESLIRPRWMCDARGWDWSINRIMSGQSLKALTPYLSRSRNIGKFGGVYCTPQYYEHCVGGHMASVGSFGTSFAID